jgi:hypothetical protein
VVVREDADDRPLVHGRVGEELVGPLDDELVHVRETLRRDELRPRVAHRDAVAEVAADGSERSGVVDGAEDVHVRARCERGDEELSLRRVDDAVLPAGEQGRRRAVVVEGDEPLGARVVARDADLEGNRPLLAHRVGDRRDEPWIEAVDEDVHGAAAREPDLEGLLVGDPVGLEPRLAPGKHLPGLAVDRRLDAAARDRAGHVAGLRDREDGAGIARSRALRGDHGRDRDGRAAGGPALECLQNVSHDALDP